MSVPTFTWEPGVHPAADLFPMMDPETFAKLVEDIRENGQVDPIVILADHRLLDGRNRLAACQALGRKAEVRYYRGDNPTAHVISLNVHRRNLTTGQLAMIAAESLPLFEAEAKERQRAAGGDHTSEAARAVSADRHTPLTTGGSRAANQAGDAVGVSGRSVAKAKRVMEVAPELVPLVRSGELSIDAANTAIRKADVAPILKPEPKASRFRKINHSSVVERTVLSVRALPDVLDAIPADAVFDEARTDEWVKDLTRVIGSLRKLRTRLLENKSC